MQETKRPSLREAARRGVEAKRQQQASAAPKPAPAVLAPAKPAKQTTVAAATCGHEVAFFDQGKPAFNDSKRKAIESKPCDDCRRKATAEREAAEQAAARGRREEKAARAAAEGGARLKPRLGRLPHGSSFAVSWDATAGQWSGTLTVPAGGIYRASVVSGEETAVFALLQSLDRAYRKLPAEETTEPLAGLDAPALQAPAALPLVS